jgi:hypothetical protein
MALKRTIKWLALALVFSSLCGCLGGSVAQQIARSILMKGADTATAAALDAHERKEKFTAQQMPLKDTVPSEYQIAFVNSGFDNVVAQVEPLPETSLENEKPLQIMQETKLVQVEVWSLLVGDEKQNVLEKARIKGSTSIPPKAEWQQWQIAVGAADNTTNHKNANAEQQAITFLIPPEMGKMHSGAKALVEISSAGELNVARYALN